MKKSILILLALLFAQYSNLFACGYGPLSIRALIASADVIVTVELNQEVLQNTKNFKVHKVLKGKYNAEHLPQYTFYNYSPAFFKDKKNKVPVYGIAYLTKSTNKTYRSVRASNSTEQYYDMKLAKVSINRIKQMVAIQDMEASDKRDIKTLDWIIKGLEVSPTTQTNLSYYRKRNWSSESEFDLRMLAEGTDTNRYGYVRISDAVKNKTKVNFSNLTADQKQRIFNTYQKLKTPSQNYKVLVTKLGFELESEAKKS